MLTFSICLLLLPNLAISTHVTSLMDYLRSQAGQYIDILPPDVPLYLDVTVLLEEIKEISDVHEKMITKIRVQVNWYDYYFGWNSTDFYLTSLILQQRAIWKPDIAILNEVSTIKSLGSHDLPLTLFGDEGMIYWAPMTIAETKCDFDLEYYPYDVQKCSIKVGTIASSTEHIILWNTYCDVAEHVEGTGSWTFEKMEYNMTTETLDQYLHLEHQVIQCTVHLKRKSSFIIVNVIFPIILLGLLNSLSFLIPDESGEKVSYSITLFLTFAVFITIMMDRMPENGDKVTKIQLYLTYQLAISVLIIVICVIQMRLQRGRLQNNHFAQDSASENGHHYSRKVGFSKERKEENFDGVVSYLPDPHKGPTGTDAPKSVNQSCDTFDDKLTNLTDDTETIIMNTVKSNGSIMVKDHNDNKEESGKEPNRWAMLQRKKNSKCSKCVREMFTVDIMGFFSVITLQVICNAWFFASILL